MRMILCFIATLFSFPSIYAQTEKVVTGRFGDCDPVVVLPQSCVGWRPSSECEKKFDAYLNTQFVKFVMDPVAHYFDSLGYEKVELGRKPLNLVGCGDEKNFYTVFYGFRDGVMVMRNNSMRDLFSIDRLGEIQDSLGSIERNKGDTLPDMEKLSKKANAIWARDVANSPREIRVQCEINYGIKYNYGGQIVMLSHPGASFVVQGGKHLRGGHGGVDSDATSLNYGEVLIGIGNWGAPTVHAYDSASFQLSLHPRFNKSASFLSVQNILISVKAIPGLSNKVLDLIDWKGLNAMLDTGSRSN